MVAWSTRSELPEAAHTTARQKTGEGRQRSHLRVLLGLPLTFLPSFEKSNWDLVRDIFFNFLNFPIWRFFCFVITSAGRLSGFLKTRWVQVLEEFIRPVSIFKKNYNYFSKDLSKVSTIWEKYFHLDFKVLGLTHFRLSSIFFTYRFLKFILFQI
jgi:hypothetical protein